ncbi:hypothetical protein BU16DRAFT_522975 [Lophium mytilinum]|uniref:Uncharacterized protein n=1 Tax=Lophium mytilinum TaxID=390894 RepID=A0A6A6R8G6_9PEZI|nr:hypothetical protein BU16DRAFT_522975 [Lophium mytilinum]
MRTIKEEKHVFPVRPSHIQMCFQARPALGKRESSYHRFTYIFGTEHLEYDSNSKPANKPVTRPKSEGFRRGSSACCVLPRSALTSPSRELLSIEKKREPSPWSPAAIPQRQSSTTVKNMASLIITGAVVVGKRMHEKHKDRKAAIIQAQQQADAQLRATESQLQLNLREAMWENELKTSMQQSEVKVRNTRVETFPRLGEKGEKDPPPAYMDVVGSRRAPEVVKGEDRFAGFAGEIGDVRRDCRASTAHERGDRHTSHHTAHGLGLSGVTA